jgi:hypothetical protein
MFFEFLFRSTGFQIELDSSNHLIVIVIIFLSVVVVSIISRVRHENGRAFATNTNKILFIYSSTFPLIVFKIKAV